jgi:hypothetical protein
MRGKKVDTDFINQFILESVAQDCVTTEDIVSRAKSSIKMIDQKIMEVEKLKVERSKLLDVISSFEKGTRADIPEAKLLSFYQIKNTNLCKYICGIIEKRVATIDQILMSSYMAMSNEEVIFCLKQLMEHKIVARMGDTFLRGDRFEEYTKFVLREMV